MAQSLPAAADTAAASSKLPIKSEAADELSDFLSDDHHCSTTVVLSLERAYFRKTVTMINDKAYVLIEINPGLERKITRHSVILGLVIC